MLDKLKITLEEVHVLEQSTKQQSSSSKWQASREERVTTSCFGGVVLRCSLPIDVFINSFFESKDYTSLPVQLSHGCHNEGKSCNIYTGFTVGLCGLVVNPSLPWLGASPDGTYYMTRDQPIMLIFLPIMLCCSAQNYAQHYAHVKNYA